MSETKSQDVSMSHEEKPVKKRQLGTISGKPICCCCPDTKLARDECIVMNGEDKCFDLIEAHKRCLRAEGFNI